MSYYTGLYEKQFRAKNLWRSTIISTLIILAVYSLLPERFRFSRGIVLTGSVFSYVLLNLWRWLLLKTDVLQKAEDEEDHFSIVAGTQKDLQTVNTILKAAGRQQIIQGFISPLNEEHSLGTIKDMHHLLRNTPVKELILCQSDALSFAQIISLYEQTGKQVKLRLHAAASKSIIGSDSKNEAGEVLNTQSYKLAKLVNRRIKRLIDFSTATFFLLLFPVHFLFNKHPIQFLKHCIQVLLYQKTWIGYSGVHASFPAIKSSVLGPAGVPHSKTQLNAEGLLLADEWYAREYEPAYDLQTIFTNYKKLGIR